ncbi:MAG: hypothetical protein QXE31_00980 [Candidatus Woesearchaeota archaeon]
MIDKDKVKEFVKLKGPVLPRDVSKEFKVDTFITGAVLSTLVDNKELKISYAKIGGSPVYYADGQESKLVMLYNYLPSKEKEAFNLLKEKKVLRDADLEPSIRVALKNIKDFAKPLEVNINNNKEIFWKWFLLSNNEAEIYIKNVMIGLISKNQENIENIDKKIDTEKEILNDEKNNIMDNEKNFINNMHNKNLNHYDNIENDNIEKKETIIYSKNNIDKNNIEKLRNKKLEKEIINKKIDSMKNETNIIENLIKTDTLNKLNLEKDSESDAFLRKIINLFKEKNVEIINYNIIRKNNDIEMKIIIPSNVGKLNYYCKAKNKKKVDDKELSSIFVLSQMKKLPILYITTGELSKKAKELLENEFKNICVYKLE